MMYYTRKGKDISIKWEKIGLTKFFIIKKKKKKRKTFIFEVHCPTERYMIL